MDSGSACGLPWEVILGDDSGLRPLRLPHDPKIRAGNGPMLYPAIAD